MDKFNGYEKYKYDGYTIYGTISSAEPIEHAVEDARTKQRKPQTQNNDTKQSKIKNRKYNGNNKSGRFLVICITILCFACTVFAADLFSGNATLATYATLLFGKNQKRKNDAYYLVYATYAEDIGVSYKNAATIRKEGGAGYVMKIEDEYYVILNAYARKEDAEKIAKKQAAYGVYELKLYAFDMERTKDLKGSATSESLYKSVFETLYETAVSKQTSIFSDEDVKAELRPIKEKIEVAESAFTESVKDGTSNVALDYKVLLRTMKSSVENILESESDLLPLLRYYAVSILHSQALFREKYFA